MKYTFKRTAPIETHEGITVVRADLVPNPPLPPYLKMIELLKFLEHVKKERDPTCVGYWATPDSDWVRILPTLAAEFGMTGYVGYPKTKAPPPYFIQEVPAKNVIWFTPNMYKVNYHRMKKAVEEVGGIQLPMGVDHPVVVKSIKEFFDGSPLPRTVDHYVIPSGSGVATAGILQHLGDGARNVHCVCSRSPDSVKKVIAPHVFGSILERAIFHEQEEPFRNPPFPSHKFWEKRAWEWLMQHRSTLKGSICFVNLGS